MRRLAAGLLALALLVGAHALAPAARATAALPGHPFIAALGPLRPLIAELYRLRFDASRSADRVLGQLDDAWTILSLCPDRPEEFVGFGLYFVVDAPPLVADPVERGALARAGLELFAWGRRLHPRSSLVPLTEGIALERLRRADLVERAAAGFATEEELLARLLDRSDEALRNAADPDDAWRAPVRTDVCHWLGALLSRGELSAELRVRAVALARRLLAWSDLPAADRDALAAAVR
jgi:hypothetical protein